MLKNNINTVGNTPLVKQTYGDREIYIKLEYCNPSGSMKDRAALHIIDSAYKLGIINNQNKTQSQVDIIQSY